MRIARVSVYKVEIPFALSVNHNLKKRQCSESLVIQLESSDGLFGYGEGAPRKYVNGVGFDDVEQHLSACLDLLHGVVITDVKDIRDICKLILDRHYLPSLSSAIEIAMLDLLGQGNGISIADVLGGDHGQPIVYSAVIPYLTDANRDRILHVVTTNGFTQAKVKVGQADDYEQLSMIRKLLGPSVDIRVDANRAWTFTEAIAMIPMLKSLNVTSIEEPLNENEIDRLPELSQKIMISLMLDESVYNLVQAKHFFERINPKQLLFNLKISKSTGLLGAQRLYQFAQERQIACQLGCNVGETAILSAAGRLFAQTHRLRHIEGSFAPYFMKDDIGTKPFTFGYGGKAKSLTMPGLGLTIDPDKLDQYGTILAEVVL